MSTVQHRPPTIPQKFLISLGMGYVPELTQDPTAQTKLIVPAGLLNPPAYMSKRSSREKTFQDVDKLAAKVSELAVTETPAAIPHSRSDDTIASQHPNEVSVPKLVVQDRPAPVPLDSEDTLISQRPRSYSSDSESTLTETRPVALTQYVQATCPHITQSFCTRPLLLPGWSIEEIAGFSGWFTKKLKKDLEWERIYLRIPERHVPVPGPDPGYGTISIDISPPTSTQLPPSTTTIIYLGGILTPKEHNISRWQFDALADPNGAYKFRVAFFNIRGHHGNPMTSARLFDPHFDNEDFAAVVSYLHTRFPEAPLIAQSFSFGGPIVTRYMAQLGSRCPLHAAVLLAPCMNIAHGLATFAQNKVTRPGAIYSANAVRKMYTSAADKFAAAGFPVDNLPAPKGPYIGDLYEVLMPYLTGYSYQEFTDTLTNDLEEGIPAITVPTFYIGSYRDKSTGIEPKIDLAVGKNPNFVRLMAQSRSHLGYYSGFPKPKRWAQKPIFEFIQAMANVPVRKDTKLKLEWNRYFDGTEIVYEALAEKDNADAKPRRHGENTDIRAG